jgi:hypothetical protein
MNDILFCFQRPGVGDETGNFEFVCITTVYLQSLEHYLFAILEFF